MPGNVMRRKVVHVSAPRSAAQPGDHVIEGDDDAEGGVPDDDRRQPEVDARRLNGGAQRDPRHDAGKRNRQDEQE